ncbi:MAG: M14 family zinc carboxypeptidase [Candidatus Krumholzibacteriia bacterium]
MRCTSAVLSLVLGFWCVEAQATRSLLAVSPRSPWTMRELESMHLDLVSHDPETGVVYLTASPQETRGLLDAGFLVSTIEPDVEAGLRELRQIPGLGLYHTYDETVAEMESLHAVAPTITRLEVIGHSFEGRPIHALKISDEPDLEDPDEADVLIVGNHHARELMSVEVPLHLARTLIAAYGRSPRLSALVDGREVWIVPMLNPDGHVFQEQTQRRPGWRKNRRTIGDGTVGVDLNRNYAYLWGHDNIGSSPDPLNETYRGEHAFSEPESDAIRQLAERCDFRITISYHSFGELLLYPWGWTRSQVTPHHHTYTTLADSMVRTNGYRPGNAFSGAIYITNGDLDDYMYGEVNPEKESRAFAFTVELNSVRQGGFWPAESMITPTCLLLLDLNLFAIRAADDVWAVSPPAAPILTASQDPDDGRIIHMSWTDPGDAAHPIDHYEVFEIDPIGMPGAWRSSTQVSLDAAGRGMLAAGIQVPPSGALVVHMQAELENLWDYAYVEVRPEGGDWQALGGDATRDLDPTRRNAGNGITGSLPMKLLRFDASAFAARSVDVAVRLDPHPDSPRRPHVRAALNVPATMVERRRIIDPDVRDTQYVVFAARPGIFAYGVTAVDAYDQRTDSDLAWFSIPETVSIEIRDLHLEVDGSTARLRWSDRSSAATRFEAWTRALAANHRPAAAALEWERGDYQLAAVTNAPAAAVLEWELRPGAHAVLLRAADEDGSRLWGPWVAVVGRVTHLHPAVPNPFNPSTRLRFEVASEAPVRLDIVRVDGRLVRRLVDRTLPAGAHDVRWDGLDHAGHPVASGVYVGRLRVAGATHTSRLVLLR